jgi:uncharacterized coiled-coil protein SlyX
VLEVDLLGAAVLCFGIYFLAKTMRTLERLVREMSSTLIEVRVTLEEMQNHLRTIDGGIADLQSEGRTVARVLTEERRASLGPN